MKMEKMSPYKSILFKYVSFGIALFTVLANGIRFSKLRRETISKFVILIKNLVISDFLTGFFMLTLKTMSLFMNGALKNNIIAFEVFTWLRFFCIRFTFVTSVINQILITSMQFVAIVFPVKYKFISNKKIHMLCASSWVVAACYTITLYLYVRICLNKTDERNFQTKSDLMFPIVSYIAVITFLSAYPTIFTKLHRRSQRVLRMKSHLSVNRIDESPVKRKQQNSSTERRFLKMALKTALTFSICWIPISTFRLLQVTGNSNCGFKDCGPTFFTFAFLSSLINPFLFSVKNRDEKPVAKESLSTMTSLNGSTNSVIDVVITNEKDPVSESEQNQERTYVRRKNGVQEKTEKYLKKF